MDGGSDLAFRKAFTQIQVVMPTSKLPISSKHRDINPSTAFRKSLDLDPSTKEKIRNGGTDLIFELFMVKQVAGQVQTMFSQHMGIDKSAGQAQTKFS